MVNVDVVEEVVAPMVVVVVVELVDGLEVEVEEYPQLMLWMNLSMLTFRSMLMVCSAQHTFFLYLLRYHSLSSST